MLCVFGPVHARVPSFYWEAVLKPRHFVSVWSSVDFLRKEVEIENLGQGWGLAYR